MFGLTPIRDDGVACKTNVEVTVNLQDLSSLLFRFSPDSIVLSSGDRITFRNNIMAFLPNDSQVWYAVTNTEQVYNTAVQAYNKLIATQMFYNAISFDFDAASEFIFKDIPDEFEESQG